MGVVVHGVCVCVCVCVCIAVRYMNIVVLSFSMHALLGPGYLMEYKIVLQYTSHCSVSTHLSSQPASQSSNSSSCACLQGKENDNQAKLCLSCDPTPINYTMVAKIEF